MGAGHELSLQLNDPRLEKRYYNVLEIEPDSILPQKKLDKATGFRLLSNILYMYSLQGFEVFNGCIDIVWLAELILNLGK